MNKQSFPIRSRPRPSPEAWNVHKDTIVRMYTREEMKLEDVMREMAKRYLFEARFGGNFLHFYNMLTWSESTRVPESIQEMGNTQIHKQTREGKYLELGFKKTKRVRIGKIL